MKEDGYLLSTYNASGKHYNMSRCSQRDMLANITGKRKTAPSCLNQTETKSQSKKLPSEMFQYREYCRGYFNKNPYMQDCSKEQKKTAHLGVCRSCCSNTTLLYKPVTDIVALDGTKCGENQICISGECVTDPRNVTLGYQKCVSCAPLTSVTTTS
ncbi:A disintegrin and metalloproteinase with thrombospondin motifs like [Amblyomma americanum]